MKKLNAHPGAGLGDEVARKIAEEIEGVIAYLDSVKSKNDFFVLVANKFSAARNYPKVYSDAGHENCTDLFFEHEIKMRYGDGVYGAEKVMVVVRFYIPAMFIVEEQKEVMLSFTRDGEEKASDTSCVEFYSAFGFIPDR